LWVSDHIFVKPVANKHYYVNAASIKNIGISNRHRLKGSRASGPGEVSTKFVEKSAEAAYSISALAVNTIEFFITVILLSDLKAFSIFGF